MCPSRSLTLACCAAAALAAPGFALADGPEAGRLAAIVRQIDLIDRLAEDAREAASSQAETRYRFDYVRLRDDLARVRAGLQDYLAPPRAQPRDLAPLSGAYRRERETAR
jgi:RAQPRD family integrative conjugative element protein